MSTAEEQPVCSPCCLASFEIDTQQVTVPCKRLKQLDINFKILNLNRRQTSVSLLNDPASPSAFRAGDAPVDQCGSVFLSAPYCSTSV